MSSQVVDSGFTRGPNNQPPPDGFAAKARHLTVQQLRRLYRCSDHLILRWLGEAGIARKRHHPAAAPPDFAARAAVLHFSALCRHYGVSERRVRRWIAETGAEPLPFARPSRPKPAPKRPRGRPKQARPWPPPLALPPRRPAPRDPPRNGSPEGLAADHLRHFAPCYRCDADGRAALAGGWWRYGNVVLAPDELRLRAVRLGWRADSKGAGK